VQRSTMSQLTERPWTGSTWRWDMHRQQQDHHLLEGECPGHQEHMEGLDMVAPWQATADPQGHLHLEDSMATGAEGRLLQLVGMGDHLHPGSDLPLDTCHMELIAFLQWRDSLREVSNATTCLHFLWTRWRSGL
jgi:hypothetical protein